MRSAVLVACLLLVPCVLAIGISPPQGQVDFVPGKTYEFSIMVINGNDFPINALVRTEGEFSSGIVVKPTKISAGGTAVVPISVTLPQTLDKPGMHTSYIYFTEQYTDQNAGTFQVRTEVGFRLKVWQPYPGKYAEITAAAPSVSQGQDATMTVRVTSFGTDPISGTASVNIVSAGGQLQDVITIPSVQVAGNSYQEYNRGLSSSTYKPGRYLLESKLDYGDNISYSNSTFIVGTQDVDILGIDGPFYLDKPVNKYALNVQNLWNLPLDNVYAVVQVGTSKSTTPSATLPAFGQVGLEGYWETDKSVQPGEVVATATVYFPNGSKQAFVPIQVYNQTPAPPALEQPTTITLSAADLIFICLAISVVIAIVLFALHQHERKPPAQPPQPGKNQP